MGDACRDAMKGAELWHHVHHVEMDDVGRITRAGAYWDD